MKLDKLVQNRYSCKKFDLKKPNWRTIIECMDIMRYTPMAGKNYSLKLIMVDDEDKIQKLAKAAEQDFIKQSKFVVAVVTSTSRTKNLFGVRAEKYLHQQAGAAIQNFLLKLEEKGLATCWIGHFSDSKVKKLLGVSGDNEVEAIFPIGYPLKKPVTRKAPIDLDKIISFNELGNSHMKSPRKLNV